MKPVGIYIIERVGTPDAYVGQSINIDVRWACHRKDLKAGCHASKHMQAVYNREGLSAFKFSILESGFDPVNKGALTAAEQKWIDVIKPSFNSAPSAASCSGFKHSTETRQKHSVLMKGNTINVGRKPWMKGKRHSPESLARLSESKRGQPGPNPGIPRSDSVKLKISLKKKGVPWSPARRAALLRNKQEVNLHA